MHELQGGISLLSIAGKIMACIIFKRINGKICSHILRDTQCGFRSNRSTIDMVFSLRQIEEKFTEQNVELYAVFINFSKPLIQFQEKDSDGCTHRLVNLIKALHDGMND